MLWTAPPPARERHGNGAVEAPTIRRSQACRRSQQLVSISRSQSFRFTALMRLGKSWSAGSEAPLRVGLLPKAPAMPSWHRGLRLGAPLGARAAGTRPHRKADAAGLR